VTATAEQIDAEFRARAQAIFNEVAGDVLGRQPRYRYFAHHNYRYGWTTERVRGQYESFVYQPVGKGSRTGKARSWKLTRVCRHKMRKAAKARALRMWETARGGASWTPKGQTP
jgi:hypothetical protein